MLLSAVRDRSTFENVLSASVVHAGKFARTVIIVCMVGKDAETSSSFGGFRRLLAAYTLGTLLLPVFFRFYGTFAAQNINVFLKY